MFMLQFFLLICESIFKLGRCYLVRISTLIVFREGVYVRVHGQLKELQGKKHLMVFGIKYDLYFFSSKLPFFVSRYFNLCFKS
ncbi:hypothetical protein Hanom_Chr05g00409991 [Helianthus anomalus]